MSKVDEILLAYGIELNLDDTKSQLRSALLEGSPKSKRITPYRNIKVLREEEEREDARLGGFNQSNQLWHEHIKKVCE